MKEYIGIGSIIPCLGGFYKIKSNNGSGLIYCEKYDTVTNEDGKEILVDADSGLTINEFERYAKEIDGKNHKFVWTNDKSKIDR